MIDLPQGAKFTTVELKTNFLGSTLSGMLTCEARRVHGGRTTQVWDAEVKVENRESPLALFRCTQMVLLR
jgi:1,4-dihydroxy-2-naphthoyl-CoA hydrolase